MENAAEYACRREVENACVLSQADRSIKRFFALDHAVYEQGVLPRKVKELVGLAASTVLRCDDCISYHLIEAVGQGATSAEIVEALGIALVVGGSITIPHLRHALAFLETIERDEPVDEI
jgi:ribonuclease HI